MIQWVVRAILVMQLLFACSVVSYVAYWRERESALGEVWGSVLWGVAYWVKSVLIVLAIIYGPEKNHWIVLYGVLAGITFAVGDIGLLALWRRE